jgi:hypothetical protein
MATPAAAPPLPTSAANLAGQLKEAGWRYLVSAGLRSGGPEWWFSVEGDHPTDPYRRVRASYHGRRLYDVLLFVKYRGWTSGHSLIATAAYITEPSAED